MAKERKPRVIARYEEGSILISTMGDGSWASPGIDIELTFDLGGHGAAMELFECAVASIRSQVADAAEGGGSG